MKKKKHDKICKTDKVCCECGYKFLTAEQKESGNTRTGYFQRGNCCVCKEDTFVCDISHYNNLKAN